MKSLLLLISVVLKHDKVYTEILFTRKKPGFNQLLLRLGTRPESYRKDMGSKKQSFLVIWWVEALVEFFRKLIGSQQ